ncbi:MAG: hypothetical protein J07HX5_01646 [halophilic archaeon J07HX5]|nr:MAG: hypothetical protein J07HX5_01646 [halophilic archaeon J07HX5]
MMGQSDSERSRCQPPKRPTISDVRVRACVRFPILAALVPGVVFGCRHETLDKCTTAGRVAGHNT